MTKEEIRDILEEIGTLLELKGENPFQCRAYYNAARSLDMLHGDFAAIVDSGAILRVKGIGKAIAAKIGLLINTGDLPYYRELKASIPMGLLEMRQIPGLGPKKIRTIYEQLGISTLDALETACRENRLAALGGFGQKTQANIIAGLERLKTYLQQHLFHHAWPEAQALLAAIAAHPAVVQADIAGSLRRKKEVVKDIDLVVASSAPVEVMAFFIALPAVDRVVAQGETKSSVLLKSGIPVDLRVVSPAEYPFALMHFTGSREHNTQMRQRAKARGLKLNEYGLFDAQEENVPSKPAHDEAAIFAALELPFIHPELREARGEIEAAEKQQLPHLIERQDLLGTFHVHTTYSDGRDDLETMVKAAQKAGLTYLGISEHSQSAYYAGGLSVERVLSQLQEIDELQQRFPTITLFKGIESDILSDGSLDYDETLLKRFDFVIASVHSRFHMTQEEATERIIKAIANPYTTILGHPTGRLLLSREGYPLDLEAVIEHAAQYEVVIEINGNPQRLELDWQFCRYAREKGVQVVINPDAHHAAGLSFIDYGIDVARKGWLRKADVLNTRTAREIVEYLATRRKRKGI